MENISVDKENWNLKKLDDVICSESGLKKTSQHEVLFNSGNLKTGMLAYGKQSSSSNGISDIVANFYNNAGFKVQKQFFEDKKIKISANKEDKEKYTIVIYNNPSAYTLIIS